MISRGPSVFAVPLLTGASLFLALLLGARAAEGPGVETVLAPRKGFHVTTRLLFVVDVSGSMEGEGEQAIAAVRRVLEGPTDELQAGVIAFADQPTRWGGVPEPCEHPKEEAHTRHCVLAGWASFPGRNKELLAWLRSVKPSGGTDAAKALKVALADPTDRLTVVLVSDGIFDGEAALNALRAGQAARKKRKLAPAGVMVWATTPNAAASGALQALAKVGGGGLWLEREGGEAEAREKD
ncbi:MAG: hypothetical protein AB7N76_00365 [Planctomycetota bacterium]